MFISGWTSLTSLVHPWQDIRQHSKGTGGTPERSDSGISPINSRIYRLSKMYSVWLLLWTTFLALAQSHTVITYPGWRGNNLNTNDEFPYGMQRSYPCELFLISPLNSWSQFMSLQVGNIGDDEGDFYGCISLSKQPASNISMHRILLQYSWSLGGGIPLSTNRTNWPVAGGAIAIQPGWFTGHAKSSININLGLGTDGPDGGPETMSMIMIPTFTIYGPSNNPFPGQFCLSQVPLPAGVKVNVGDHATIQVIETFDYGGALYNVRTIPQFALND